MSRFTGTGALVRLALRVDRIRLPVWVGAMTLIVVVTAISFAGLYPDAASRQQFAMGIGTNPALRALYGPLHGGDQIGGLTVWRQGAIQLVLVSLMSLFVVVRHTRAAEETGRLELVGAGVVGRAAPLAAALATAAIADVAVGAAVAVGMIAAGEAAAGSLAFGAGLTAAGLVFAGIGAVAAQLAASSRGANGVAGAVLGVAFALRAAGDAAGDGAMSWLTWLSPLGWSQQLRPYGDERWWPLALHLLLVVGAMGAAGALRARRDLDSGLLASRPGPPRAPRSLRSPAGLAWRLQRGGLGWWAVGMVAAGLVFGGVVDAITQLFDDSPQLADILARLGGSARIVDAFLGAILSVFAVLASAWAVGATLLVRTEENTDRAEPVLATAVTRTRWAGAHVAVALLGPAGLLALAGAAAGLAAGLVTGRGLSQVGRLTAAALVQLPAVWVLVGLTVLVIGVLPQWSTAAYGVLALFLLLGQVGEALQLDQALLDLSPFVHPPALPGAAMTWTPLLWLTAVAAALLTPGLDGPATARPRGVDAPPHPTPLVSRPTSGSRR